MKKRNRQNLSLISLARDQATVVAGGTAEICICRCKPNDLGRDFVGSDQGFCPDGLAMLAMLAPGGRS